MELLVSLSRGRKNEDNLKNDDNLRKMMITSKKNQNHLKSGNDLKNKKLRQAQK